MKTAWTKSSFMVLGSVWGTIVVAQGAIQQANAESTNSIMADQMPRVQFKMGETPKANADGRSLVTLEGEILKASGEVMAEDVTVTLTTSAGQFVGVDADRDRAGFQVKAVGGKFSAQLQSPIQAQQATVRAAIDRVYDLEAGKRKDFGSQTLPLPNTPYVSQTIAPTEAFTTVEFLTYLRPSLVSGSLNLRLGNGNADFYSSFREFIDQDNGNFEADLQGGLFATGKVGEWLFTGAVNLDRALNETCDGNRLYRDDQFCEKSYPVYGDSSRIDFLTPSRDSFYARFEKDSAYSRESDYVMWGDYGTQEFARSSQLYSGFTRQLHGAKLNYSLGNLQLTGLFATSTEAFRRDELRPTGISGDYYLSKRTIVPGSEDIFIEAEETNRPGSTVARKQLIRGRDYEIDYDRGSLRFRKPILAVDFGEDLTTTLVRKVVATYQYERDDDGTYGVYGGRAQYNFSNTIGQESWLGATYFAEDLDGNDFSLFGADLKVPLGTTGNLIAEYASSRNGSDYLGEVDGTAFRIEAEGQAADWLRARAYYRRAEDGFSNNATTSFTPGQSRYGVQATAKAGPQTEVTASIDREENFGKSVRLQPRFFSLFDPNPNVVVDENLDNSLTTIRAGVTQGLGGESKLSLEYVNRNRDDKKGQLSDGNSSQLVTRLAVPFADSLTFRAQNELNLGDSDELYPNRTTLALDWAAYPGIKLRLAHQFLDGGLFGKKAITALETISDYKLSENTTLTGRYSVISGTNGVNGQGAVGLDHRWVVTPGFKVNLSYEHIFGDTFSRTGAGRRFETPYTVGQTGSVLGLSAGDSYGIGFEYTGLEKFKASGRVEYRSAEEGNALLLSASALGKVSPELSLLGRFEKAGASNQDLIGRFGDNLNLKLGLAYRNPNSDRWNTLAKYEYRENDKITPDAIGTGSESKSHVLALETIYSPNWKWEFYGKYAAKLTDTRIGNSYSNNTFISLAQLRALYNFSYRWDAAAEVRWISQPSANYNALGWALEGGYSLTPDLRLYLGYAFGSADDRDFSGYRSDGGIYGGVNFKVNSLFNGFGVQKPVEKPRPPRKEVEPEPEPIEETTVPITEEVPEMAQPIPAPAEQPVQRAKPVRALF